MTNTDNKTLRLFTLALSLAALFWLFIFSHTNDTTLHNYPFTLAGIVGFCLIGLVKPSFYKTPFKYWSLLADGLNQLIIKTLLSIIFLLLITPIGIIKRLFGHDALKDKHFIAGSYRHLSKPQDKADMEQPF